jgi:hypothetical protein
VLTKNAPLSLLLTADSATLKLENQKNGWKGVCMHQEANGEEFKCPVRALAQQVIHLQEHNANGKTFLLTFFQNSAHYDVCGEDISRGLKLAASILQYPVTRGIPIDQIDMHSLRSGGANALSLAGYTDMQIQKMGRWKGATFKEYICEELHCFSEGMTKNMKRNFKFVNVSGGAYHDVTDQCLESDYNINSAAAA